MTQPSLSISVAKPQSSARSGFPLVRFRGTLKDHIIGTEGNPGQERVVVTFNFTDVTVIESEEPYAFPIAVIKLSYSDKENTQWSTFTESFRALVPEEAYSGQSDPLTPLDGRGQEWLYAPTMFRRPLKNEDGSDKVENGKAVWGMVEARSWKLAAVDGFGAAGSSDVSLMDMIVDYADGRKDAEIYQWIYTDQSIKGKSDFTDVVAAAADRTLLSTLVQVGKLKLNPDTTYSKVV